MLDPTNPRMDEARPNHMPKEIEYAVVGLVTDILGASTSATPEWLVRPGRVECGDRWPLVCTIYSELTELKLADEMRKVERRTVDAVLVLPGSPPRVLEVDEKQHFNADRSATLRHYKDDVPLAFDADLWIARSDAKLKLEGAASAGPCPAVPRRWRSASAARPPRRFDRHPCGTSWFRADAANFEVKDWINQPDRAERMRQLLSERL